MTPEQSNAINSIARAALKEYNSNNNKLTYRQILDKHSNKIEMLIPAKHRGRAWLWLNCVCQSLAKG